MKKLRCIIADDEPLAVKLLESYINRSERLELVGAFTSATEALQTLAADEVDIALLDIQMPQLSGLDIARALAEKSTAVIFVTAFRDYAFEGFRVHAADYLLKPVSFEEFSEAVGRLIEQKDVATSEPISGMLTVRSDYRQMRIDFADILYVEGLKDYVKIYVAGRERPIMTQMSLKAVEAALPAADFVRIHRSYIAAMRHISSYDRTSATINGLPLPLGDTYRTRFFNRMD